jgi:hypothetical protein
MNIQTKQQAIAYLRMGVVGTHTKAATAGNSSTRSSTFQVTDMSYCSGITGSVMHSCLRVMPSLLFYNTRISIQILPYAMRKPHANS